MIILLIALALALLVMFMISATAKPPVRHRHRRPGHVDRQLVRQRWTTIKHLSEQGGVGLRSAVSEADKLLDHILRQRGYQGNTMAERLKNAEREFSDKNAVWRAHKLRNALAHEVEFDLVASQAKEAIRTLEVALKDLGGI